MSEKEYSLSELNFCDDCDVPIRKHHRCRRCYAKKHDEDIEDLEKVQVSYEKIKDMNQ